MTTPNNQPKPPEGMRIIPLEYLEAGNPLPMDAKWISEGLRPLEGKWDPCPWAGETLAEWQITPFLYATAEQIPITPTVPATGEASLAESCLGPQRPMTEEEQEMIHDFQLGDTTPNEKGGEQRQELPIPEAHYSCGGSCRKDRSLPADDLAWFPKVKLWICSECSEDQEEVGDAEITLDKYLKSRK